MKNQEEEVDYSSAAYTLKEELFRLTCYMENQTKRCTYRNDEDELIIYEEGMEKETFESENLEILHQYGLDVNEVYDMMRQQLDSYE